MRYPFTLLMIISFSSFALAQDERHEETPNPHYHPFIYSNLWNLKATLDKVAKKLKSSSEFKAVIIYYKNNKQNKINFSQFKSKVQNILSKSNKVESLRFKVITSNTPQNIGSFDIWIIDKKGNPVRDW